MGTKGINDLLSAFHVYRDQVDALMSLRSLIKPANIFSFYDKITGGDGTNIKLGNDPRSIGSGPYHQFKIIYKDNKKTKELSTIYDVIWNRLQYDPYPDNN